MSRERLGSGRVPTGTLAPVSEPVPNPEAPNPQLPTVARMRIRYAKRGRLRFTSHRDFGRAFERAIRRSGVPVAYSSGFTPHPKVSYAGAAPTGAASDAEYLEIGLTRECDPDHVRRDLDAALPDGLDVLTVCRAGSAGDDGSLADLLQASQWQIRLGGVDPEAARSAVDTFLAQESVEVERMAKKGLRRFDCRVVVTRLTAVPAPDHHRCAILTVVVRHETPAVRPDDVLAGLRVVAGLEPTDPPQVARTAQGPLDPRDGTVGDPFALDRDAS